MYCHQCGKELKEGEEICSNCGYNNKSTNNVNVETQCNTNNSNDGFIKRYISENNIKSPMALIGFISSVLGLFVIPYLFGVIAIILGILSLQQVKIDKKGKTQAIIAVILGIVDVMLPSFLAGLWQGFWMTFPK